MVIAVLLICLVPYTVWLSSILSGSKARESDNKKEDEMRPAVLATNTVVVPVKMPRIIYGTARAPVTTGAAVLACIIDAPH